MGESVNCMCFPTKLASYEREATSALHGLICCEAAAPLVFRECGKRTGTVD